MKLFFSCVSKFSELITICVLSVITSNVSVMANPIRDLQDEVSKRGISPEDVNRAMRKSRRFPNSDFPYFAPVNGCSTPFYLATVTLGANRWFNSACNNHDRCYATPEKLRLDCDKTLKEEMLKRCESINNLECRTTAQVYYDKVREHGQEFYDAARREQSEGSMSPSE